MEEKVKLKREQKRTKNKEPVLKQALYSLLCKIYIPRICFFLAANSSAVKTPISSRSLSCFSSSIYDEEIDTCLTESLWSMVSIIFLSASLNQCA